MKKPTRLFLLLGYVFFIIGLSGCAIHPSTTEISYPEYLEQLLDQGTSPHDWKWELSPDGKWLIQPPTGRLDPIRIVSTQPDHRMIQLDVTEEIGWGAMLDEWSPDSTHITYWGLARPGKCIFDRLIIYHLQKDLQLEPNVFQLPEDEANCNGATWSPDSSQLLISTAKNLYIINNKAELVQKVSQPTNVLTIIWTKNGIFGVAQNQNQSELWRIDIQSSAIQMELLYSTDVYLGILAVDPQGEEILLFGDAKSPGYPKKKSFLIFDNKSRAIEEEILSDLTSLDDPSRSNVPSYVGFIGINSMNKLRKLYIFDWALKEIHEYGDIQFLVGWRSGANGFLAVSKEDDQYKLDVIRPSKGLYMGGE